MTSSPTRRRSKAQSLLTAWRLKHFRGIDNPRVLALFNDALPKLLARVAELENGRRGAQKKTVFWTVALTFCDTLPDYSSCYVLLISDSNYGIPMLLVLLVSMVHGRAGHHGPFSDEGGISCDRGSALWFEADHRWH